MGEVFSYSQVAPSTSIIPTEFVSLDNDLRFIKVRRGQKVPSENDWQGTRNYSVNDPDLIRWIANGGNYGYFLRDDTDLCVLDADRPEDLVDLINFLGDTLTVKSGREGNGFHILFRCAALGDKKIYLDSPDKRTDEGRPVSLGDIRPGSTEKKYQTVGPGSIHPDTGRPYLIINNHSPVEVDRDELLKLIHEQYTAPSKPVCTPGKASSDRLIPFLSRHSQPEGGRNDYLFRHACRLRSTGCEYYEICNELRTINSQDCFPPVDAQELDTICRSAVRYPAGERKVVERVAGASILRKIAFKQMMKSIRRSQ